MADQMDLTRTLISNRSGDGSDRSFRPENTDIGPIRYVFRDQEAELIEQISRYSSIVGCVAWLASFSILEARSGLKNRKIVAFPQGRRPLERLSGIYEIASMQGKRVSIVAQKEDFLRPDIGRTSQDRWKRGLRRRYDTLTSAANEKSSCCG